MSTFIYIDWDHQEYYLGWDEVVTAYRERYESDDFNEYLYDNYSCEEIFHLSEEERAEVLRNYDELMQEHAKEWAQDNLLKIEIRVEAKGE